MRRSTSRRISTIVRGFARCSDTLSPTPWRLFTLCATATIFLAGAGAETAPAWPQYHGPRRDNLSPATGLLSQWPDGGPKVAWKAPDIGGGYAIPSIAEGMIFLTGDFGPQEMVLALDMAGKILWKTPNGRSWTGPHPGSRVTPTYDKGTVYQMNPHGRLCALAARTGAERWAVDLAATFGAKPSTWALAENVIVDGDAVLCTPGGPRGRIVALDKTTGKTLWANTKIREPAQYCSPIIATHNGVRQLITILQKSIFSVEVKTGKLLWSHVHETRHDQNVTSPIYVKGHVFASSGHGTGGRLLKIAPDSRSVTQVWINSDLDNCHGGVLLLDGYVYGSGCRLKRKGLVCISLADGRTVWKQPALGKLSMTWADGMIHAIDDRGMLSLIKPGPRPAGAVSRFAIKRINRKLTLAHPVVLDGRMYIRNWNELIAYDVRK